MNPIAPEYIAARRTLLDALDALEPHQDSLVLIGAQAIYLHAGSTELTIPPMTTDADLAIDVDLLGEHPEVATTMTQAGFEPKQPGHWLNSQGIAVDLMVAPRQANRSSPNARAAHLDPHAKTTARIGPGLAATLYDNAPQTIHALDPLDTRSHCLKVAGPAALLVAKTIKINDRLQTPVGARFSESSTRMRSTCCGCCRPPPSRN